MAYVSAIYFISSFKSLNYLKEELKQPYFKDYHIFIFRDVDNDIIR